MFGNTHTLTFRQGLSFSLSARGESPLGYTCRVGHCVVDRVSTMSTDINKITCCCMDRSGTILPAGWEPGRCPLCVRLDELAKLRMHVSTQLVLVVKEVLLACCRAQLDDSVFCAMRLSFSRSCSLLAVQTNGLSATFLP